MSDEKRLGPWTVEMCHGQPWWRRKWLANRTQVRVLDSSPGFQWDAWGGGDEEDHERRSGSAPDLATAQREADAAARALGWRLPEDEATHDMCPDCGSGFPCEHDAIVAPPIPGGPICHVNADCRRILDTTPAMAFDALAERCAAEARPLPGRRPWGARWER